MDFLEKIIHYKPFNEQEEKDQNLMIDYIKNNNCLTRENQFAHLTASSWIVNKEHNKVLMVYHKIYNSWSWTGGHCDGDSDFLHVAMKEAIEETGVKHIHPISNEIYSLEVLTVDGHIKKGEYVSSHLHLNVTYLLEADEEDKLIINQDENKGVQWFGLEEALSVSSEPWFVERIYKKLNEKLKFYQ